MKFKIPKQNPLGYGRHLPQGIRVVEDTISPENRQHWVDKYPAWEKAIAEYAEGRERVNVGSLFSTLRKKLGDPCCPRYFIFRMLRKHGYMEANGWLKHFILKKFDRKNWRLLSTSKPKLLVHAGKEKYAKKR